MPLSPLETVARLSALIVGIPCRLATEAATARELLRLRSFVLRTIQGPLERGTLESPGMGCDWFQVAAQLLAARLRNLADILRKANGRRVSVRSDSARWASDIEQMALEVG